MTTDRTKSSSRVVRLAACLLAAVIVTCTCVTTLSGCTPGTQGLQKHSRTVLDCFDTPCSLTGYTDSAATFNAAADGAVGLWNEWHRKLDIYNEYEGLNNLCTLNRRAGEAVALDDDLLAFLEWTLDLCRLTKGQVNPVMGSVIALWKEAAGTGDRIPDEKSLSDAAAHISPDLLVIDRAAGTATLTDPEARVDMGAFGKGYVADLTAEWLTCHGYDHFAIDLGGNLRIVGNKTPGKPWHTGVKDPLGSGKYLEERSLSEGALATSGSYQRYFEVDGVRYHHIIDPDTLMPENVFLSVTVYAPDAAIADALSTALFNMSEDEGRALIGEMDGVWAIWIYPDGTVVK